MDDYDIELTPNDPEFGPDECESAYALWAFKEDGEPVKFLEASLVEDPDYPSGYSFSWRSLSCDRTGKLVEGEGGVIGDVSRADYVADMVLPGGAVFSQVEDEYLPSLPYSFEKDSLSDSARKSAAEAIRGAILSLPLSVPETTEAIPAFYRLDNPAMPDDPLTRDMLADALQSVENYHRGGAIDALLCNRDGMSVAKQALIVSAAKGLRSNSGLFDAMSRAVGLIRATEGSAAGVSDCALAQSLLITGFHHMQNRCFDTVSRGLGDVRYMDISKAVKIFAEELTRDTGLERSTPQENYAYTVLNDDSEFWNIMNRGDGELLSCFDFNRYGEIAVNNGYVDLCETCYVNKGGDWPLLDEYSFEEIGGETVAEWRGRVAQEKPAAPSEIAYAASALAALSADDGAGVTARAAKL